MSIATEITQIKALLPQHVRLVAVSKTYPAEAIMEAYEVGVRRFGESRPQELAAKWEALPKDIEWHMIGHLQRNKVRMIAPFVSMIESLDSERLALTIDAEAKRCDRRIDCLLEIHVAQEESKSGWQAQELMALVEQGFFSSCENIRLRGVMGIASFTSNEERVKADFEQLKAHFECLKQYFGDDFDTISMGMSDDFPLAIECGSTSVRIGSRIFGARNYNK